MELVRLLTILGILFLLLGCTGQQAGFTGTAATAATTTVVERTKVQAYFCPRDQCSQRVVAAIESAQENIDIAMYSFTSKGIADALEDAEKRKVEVRVVADYLQAQSKYSQLKELEGKGAEVRIMGSGETLHDKFAIIDNSLVITGSYNWTSNADTHNKENLVFIEDGKIAQQYESEFFNLFVEAG